MIQSILAAALVIFSASAMAKEQTVAHAAVADAEPVNTALGAEIQAVMHIPLSQITIQGEVKKGYLVPTSRANDYTFIVIMPQSFGVRPNVSAEQAKTLQPVTGEVVFDGKPVPASLTLVPGYFLKPIAGMGISAGTRGYRFAINGKNFLFVSDSAAIMGVTSKDLSNFVPTVKV